MKKTDCSMGGSGRVGVHRVAPEADRLEADHRIANSLQLVSALLTSQGREIADPDARRALDVCVQRIAAIAGVHRQLFLGGRQDEVDVAGYLLDLVEGLQHGFCRDHEHRRIHLDVEPAPVPSGFATVLGIVVSELVINACKYAYGPDQPGSIHVVLAVEEDRFSLEVRDHGAGAHVPSPSTAVSAGLGSRLLDLMARRLNAHGRYLEREVGTSYVLTGLMGAPAARQVAG
jgi:two-component sensor histidine kinase